MMVWYSRLAEHRARARAALPRSWPVVTALGVGLLLSALNVRYRDVPYAIPVPDPDLDVPLGSRVRVQRAPEKWQWVLASIR